MTSKKDNHYKSNFIGHQKNGEYGGAADLISAEKEYLENRTEKGKKNLVGLALSGGGIRSAIFSLGVMQRLARNGWMEKIDYLSTVSGGGYIGSSLTWFLHNQSSGKDGDTEFDLTADNFPFGTHRLGKINPDTEEVEKGGDQNKAAILQALRQNGKYLTPGSGITIFSLLGVFLRGTFLSIVVYFPFLVLFFLALYMAYFLRPASKYPEFLQNFSRLDMPVLNLSADLNFSLVLVLVLILFSILGAVFYAFHTYHPVLFNKRRYIGRRYFDKIAGKIIISLIVLVALGVLPFIHEWLNSLNSSDSAAILTASGSMIIGFITSVAAFKTSSLLKENKKRGNQSTFNKLLLPLLTIITVFFLFYGMFLLAYSYSYKLMESEIQGFLAIYIVWIFMALFTGRYVNINYVSVHRFYRDRLMETFMPNVDEILKNGHHDSEGATQADRLKLSDICQCDNTGPYHIINTNIVLVESPNKKYRGRGGDNFILSPQYCGSNATGWIKTVNFMNNEMTLPTAMAISGAAANPDTGVGGEGPTRNRALSLLMSLLNIRLGYWAPHPNPAIHRKEKEGLKKLNPNPLYGFRPNYFHPMLTSTAFGSFIKKITSILSSQEELGSYLGKTENSRFVELTDGGHFENLGLYELIRRKLKTIIVCDGGADPNFDFEDLANAIEKIRVDFGVVIKLDISPLVPGKKVDLKNGLRCAERGYITGTILYPDNSIGKLVYIKTTFTDGMYADLVYYKKQNPLFPDQPTSDQFFDEKQFEAYRGLGNYIAKQLAETYNLTDEGSIKKI